MYLVIITLILIIWSIYLYFILDKNIFFFFKFNDSLSEEERKKYDFYLRTDMHNLSKFKIYIKGFFLIPYRCFLYLTILVLLTITMKISLLIYKIEDFEKEYPKDFQEFITKIGNFVFKFINDYCLGLNITYKTIKSGNPSTKEEFENCKLTVSNHTSWIDGRYFLQKKPLPALLMDEFFKTKAIIGILSQINQNIFVRNIHNDKESRKKAQKLLDIRAKNLKEEKNFRPLLIFPEGMVSNSDVIITFRKGAFTLDLPTKVIALDYSNNEVVPDMSLFNFAGSFLLGLTNFRNNVTVYEFDRLMYPKEYLNEKNEIDSIKMANDCSKMIADALNIKYLHIPDIYETNYEYFTFRKNRISEIIDKKKFS